MIRFDVGAYIDEEVADVIDLYDGDVVACWEAMLKMIADREMRYLMDGWQSWLLKVELKQRIRLYFEEYDRWSNDND